MATSTLPNDLSEVYSKQIWEADDGKSRYNFRIIRYTNRKGQLVYKFGLSEWVYFERYRRWIPSSKHNAHLPVDAWSHIIEHSEIIGEYVRKQHEANAGDGVVTGAATGDGATGESAGGAADEPVRGDEVGTSHATPTKRRSGPAAGGQRQPATKRARGKHGGGPESDGKVPEKKKRGRPAGAKRSNSRKEQVAQLPTVHEEDDSDEEPAVEVSGGESDGSTSEAEDHGRQEAR